MQTTNINRGAVGQPLDFHNFVKVAQGDSDNLDEFLKEMEEDCKVIECIE